MRFFAQSVRFSSAFPCVHSLTYGPDGFAQTDFDLGEGQDAWPGSARHEVSEGGFSDAAVLGDFVDAGQLGRGSHEVLQFQDCLPYPFMCEVIDFVLWPVGVELAGCGLFRGHGLTVGQCWVGFGPRHANGWITKLWPAVLALTVVFATSIITVERLVKRPLRVASLTTKGDTPCTAHYLPSRIELTALRPHNPNTFGLASIASTVCPHLAEPAPLHPTTQHGCEVGCFCTPQRPLRGGDTP